MYVCILTAACQILLYSGHSLLWVGALGLVVLYIYSVGTLALLRNEFDEPDPEEDGDTVRFCGSLVQCFISVLEYGLLDTLGLVSKSNGIMYNTHNYYVRICMYCMCNDGAICCSF